MKKIQSSIKMLAALLVAGAAFTACSSDDNTASEQPVNPAQQTYTLTVNAAKGSNATTRALSLSGSTLNATWGAGEVVKVYNASSEEIATLTPVTAGSASADLTGTITGTVPSVNDALTLKFLSASYTSQDGTLAYIGANCDYATASVTVSSVGGGTITTTDATFTNQQAIVKFTLTDKSSNDISATQLVVNDGTTDYTIIPASATSEIYVAIPGISNKAISLTATVGYDIYTFKKSSVTFSNGSYYAITVKLEKVVPEAVDLGLTSGVKWANMNVGAGCPEDYGHYFAWGETTPQSDNVYSWASYKWCNGSSTALTKYCNNSSYGSGGFTDSKTVLDLENDAARANWGGDWRMPTQAEFQELIANTTSTWTTQNGAYGYKFTSKTNSNSIFLPAAGYRWDGGLSDDGSNGHYWSSSLFESNPSGAWYLNFKSEGVYTNNNISRYFGHSVRPVR